MAFLIDTNVVLRLFHIQDPAHPLIREAILTLTQNSELLYFTQQTRREFWNVCTRPIGSNGWGMNTLATARALDEVEELLLYIPDCAETGPEWDRLVRQYDVVGRAVHDAQLVASMLVNGITHILTLNGADFQRYSAEITVVHPQEL